MNILYTLAFFILSSSLAFGQVKLEQSFGSGQMPPGEWNLDGQPAQWSCSNSQKAGGATPEAKFSYIQVVDTSRLVSPVIDMTGTASEVKLSFKHFYNWYKNGPKIGLATRFGNGEWTTEWELTPSESIGPETVSLVMANTVQADFQFCLFIEGNLYNLNDWYIDDIKLLIPLSLDAKLESVNLPAYAGAGNDIFLKGAIENVGITPINSFDVLYQANGGSYLFSVDGLNIAFGEKYDFSVEPPINLPEPGSYEIVTSIVNVNGSNDKDTSNNAITQIVEVIPYLPQTKIFAEEATGTWCGWCVRGTCFMDYMAQTYPETWIGVAVHNRDPMVNSAYDAAISNIIPNFPGYPSAAIGRSNAKFYNPEDFEEGYLEHIEAMSPASIDIVNYSWDPETRVISLGLQSFFIADIENELRFALVITEDSLYGTAPAWGQANYYAGGTLGEMCGFEDLPNPIPAAQMVYNHVARAILDTPYGTLGSIQKPVLAGSTHSYNYTYIIPDEWRYDKLHFIGILIDVTTGEIINANNVISSYVGVAQDEPDEQVRVYPNPSNGILSIKGAEGADVSIYNLTGKKVASFNHLVSENINLSNLCNGMYILNIEFKGHTRIVKKITILR